MSEFKATLTKTYEVDAKAGVTRYRHTVRLSDGTTICAEHSLHDGEMYARPGPPVSFIDRQLQEQIVNAFRAEIYRK